MATKARHLKTPMQLWIADNRKRLKEEPADLARLTSVTVDTARGWESRGRPSEDAIAILERHFGQPAPRAEREAPQDELVAAIRDQTAAITALIEELRAERSDDREARLRVVEALVLPQGQPAAGASPRQSAPRASVG